MRTFDHVDVHNIYEACSTLRQHQGKGVLNAGGSDILTSLKAEILPDYPEIVINIKTIKGLDYIREDGEYLLIGALARLSDIARSPLIKENYRVLAQAAHSVATPQIRNVATLGGNLCQDTRCWYYRYPRNIGGPIQCLRKGSGPCLAVKGDNRYHAIMGGKKCFAVCPSDMAVALSSLDAMIKITGPDGERSVEVTDFYHPLGINLAKDEMVCEIQVPAKKVGSQQNFLKFTLRKPIDFAIVSAAVEMTIEQGICKDARVVLGAVAPYPVRAKEAEELLIGSSISDEIAAGAAEKALAGAKPLRKNEYKVQIAKALVKKAILGVTD